MSGTSGNGVVKEEETIPRESRDEERGARGEVVRKRGNGQGRMGKGGRRE